MLESIFLATSLPKSFLHLLESFYYCKQGDKIPKQREKPSVVKDGVFSMGPEWQTRWQLWQEHFQPMYQIDLIPRVRERQIHSPPPNQCLQRTGPKPTPGQPPRPKGKLTSDSVSVDSPSRERMDIHALPTRRTGVRRKP